MGQGAAAARAVGGLVARAVRAVAHDRRTRARAVARRRARGSSIPPSPSSAPATRRCCAARAAFETTRVYGGRAVLPRRPHRAARGARRPASGSSRPTATRPSGSRRRRSRPPARPTPALRLYWTGTTLVATVAEIPPELEERRAPRPAARLARLGVEPERPGWLLPGVKSTSYAVNMAGEAEAQRPRRRRRALPRERRHRARGADLEHLVAARRHALHAVARGRRARRRDARDAARARARGRLPRRARARSPLDDLRRRRRGLHLVVDPRGAAGGRARRPPDRRRRARRRGAGAPARCSASVDRRATG